MNANDEFQPAREDASEGSKERHIVCFVARTHEIHSHQRYIQHKERQIICNGRGGVPKGSQEKSGRNNATHRSDLKVWSMVRIEGSPNLDQCA